MLGIVLENECIAKEIFELEIRFECADFDKYNCGQFAHIKIPGSNEMLLRRPISIFDVNTEERTVALIYKTAGKGTERLASVKPGDIIDALLFLGNGFTLPEDARNVLLIGGGIGIAPLYNAECGMRNAEFTGVFGYQTKDMIFKRELFEEKCRELQITTEDGTEGEKGFVTSALEKLDLKSFDTILCCGPTAMLKAIAPIVLDSGVPAFVSLEERMGCGVGGCSVCVCKTTSGDYEKVCTSGPVFKLGEVVL